MILFVVSQWRAPTQTFVWREVEAAVHSGERVVVLSLKPPATKAASDPPVLFLTRSQVIRGVGRGLLHRPASTLGVLGTVVAGSSSRTIVANLYAAAAGIAAHGRLGGVEWVHGHFVWFAGTAAFAAARCLKVPFSVMAHAFDIFDVRFIDRHTIHKLRRASFVGAESRTIADEVSNRFGCTTEVVRMGVPQSYLVEATGDRDSRQLISVGSLVPKKGHDDFLRALSRIPGDWTASIVGEGPERVPLEALRFELGLDGRVDMPGHLPPDEMRALLDRAAVFCLASRITPTGDRDGVPNAVIEAMACGIPVVVTAISGLPDLVANERGCVVQTGCPDELASAIAGLLADRQRAAKLAENALAHVRAHYTTEMNWMHLRDLMRGADASSTRSPVRRATRSLASQARRSVGRLLRRVARVRASPPTRQPD